MWQQTVRLLVSPVQGVGGQDSLYSIISSLSQLVNMQEQLFF
jgi:hypothetical protein